VTTSPPRAGSVSFDKVAADYDATRGGAERGDDFAEALAPLVVGQTVLDVGVGTGVVGLGLRTRVGAAVTGIDISPAMLTFAHDRLGSVVAAGDAHQVPVRSGAVDTVVCIWVLQLVADPAGVIAECARVLRPGGRLIVVLSKAVLDDPDDVEEALDTMVDFRTLMRRPRFDIPDNVPGLAAAAGLQVGGEGRTPSRGASVTPAELIAQLESRAYGALAVLDNATFRRLTDPVLERLRALPEQDRPRHRASSYPWVAATKAGDLARAQRPA
jgi:SAM-dependent methyltransferase